ncbi:uncharacterized protein LOC143244396 [Tachypleus tridentatus]|uniref:uncharacterized protein LOC143244396 n=1 Tax=Tachypleus tridentatus TaxID=6853 RepID=UPI003FD43A13
MNEPVHIHSAYGRSSNRTSLARDSTDCSFLSLSENHGLYWNYQRSACSGLLLVLLHLRSLEVINVGLEKIETGGMPRMETCCFWKSPKTGPMICGCYTLMFYMMKMTVASFQMTFVEDSVYMALATVVCNLSLFCVVSSVLLFIGIWRSNRKFLVPWMWSLSVTTFVDIVICFYLFAQANYIPYVGLIFLIDVFICSLNAFCFFCVSSRYQDLCLEEYNIKQQLQRKATSLKRLGSSKATDSPSKKISVSTDNEGSSETHHHPVVQRKETSLSKTRQLPDLSTISEEQSLMNFNRNLSTDVTSSGPDNQALSPIVIKRTSTLSPRILLLSNEFDFEMSNEASGSTSFQNQIEDLCPLDTRNGSIQCSQSYELVNLCCTEETIHS